MTILPLLRRLAYPLLLAGILLFHVRMNYEVLSKSEICRWADEAHYLRGGVGYYQALFMPPHREQYISRRDTIVLSSPQAHPPFLAIAEASMCKLLVAFSLPLSEDSVILATNALFLLVLLVSVYGIGANLYNKTAGIFAAFLASFFPMLYGHCRIMMLDFPLASMVALSFYMLFKTHNFQLRGYSIALGIASGFTMLTKESALSFIAIPFVYYLYRSFKAHFSRKTLFNSVLTFFIALGIAGVIYFQPKNMALAIQSYLDMTFFFPNLPIRPVAYYLQSLSVYTGTYLGLAALPLLALYLKHFRAQNKALFLWCVVPFLLHTLCPNRQLRFLIPLLPALAIIIAQELVRTTISTRLKHFLACLLILPACLQYYVYFHNLRWLDRSFHSGYYNTDFPGILTYRRDKDYAAVVALLDIFRKEQRRIGNSKHQIFFLCARQRSIANSLHSRMGFANLFFMSDLLPDFEEPPRIAQPDSMGRWKDFLLKARYLVVPKPPLQGTPPYQEIAAQIDAEQVFADLGASFEKIGEALSADGCPLQVYRNLGMGS
jgi:hypothetical protein